MCHQSPDLVHRRKLCCDGTCVMPYCSLKYPLKLSASHLLSLWQIQHTSWHTVCWNCILG